MNRSIAGVSSYNMATLKELRGRLKILEGDIKAEENGSVRQIMLLEIQKDLEKEISTIIKSLQS